MSLEISSKKKVYELFEEGVQIPGVIVGVKLLEDVHTKFGPKDKVLFKILTELIDGDGDRMTAIASFTASLNEKANLRGFVSKVIGTDCGDTFDVETLVGVTKNFIFETNVTKDGRKFSNISGIFKATKKVSIPEDYVAFRSTEEEQKTGAPAPARRRVTGQSRRKVNQPLTAHIGTLIFERQLAARLL